jgi:hypothetical protein
MCSYGGDRIPTWAAGQAARALVGHSDCAAEHLDAMCGCAVIVLALVTMAWRGAGDRWEGKLARVESRRLRICPIERAANPARIVPLLAGAVASALFGSGAFGAAGLILVLARLGGPHINLIERLVGVRSDANAIWEAFIPRYEESFVYGGLSFFFRSSAPILATSLFALTGLLLVGYGEAKADAFEAILPVCRLRSLDRTALLVATALTPILRTCPRSWPPSWIAEAPTVLTLVVIGLVANVVAIRRFRMVAAVGTAKRARSVRADGMIPTVVSTTGSRAR